MGLDATLHHEAFAEAVSNEAQDSCSFCRAWVASFCYFVVCLAQNNRCASMFQALWWPMIFVRAHLQFGDLGVGTPGMGLLEIQMP